MQKRVLGMIGGSGVYSIDDLDNVEMLEIETPWGEPSSALTRGTLAGVETLFLARHGAGHRLPPTSVNYRANIDAMKRAGATDLIALSACGSFKEEAPPGTFVIVDQFIDRTSKRENSFFGPGFVAHVSMAEPVCAYLGDAVEASCKALEISYKRGGTYICMEGPQFSTLAESKLYRSWGADVIGMTNMPEAKLAREAELPYASVAMVTDFDCWHSEVKAVEVTNVLEILASNTKKARALVVNLCERLGPSREQSSQGIETVLDYAIITAPESRDAAMAAKLDAVARRILKH